MSHTVLTNAAILALWRQECHAVTLQIQNIRSRPPASADRAPFRPIPLTPRQIFDTPIADVLCRLVGYLQRGLPFDDAEALQVKFTLCRLRAEHSWIKSEWDELDLIGESIEEWCLHTHKVHHGPLMTSEKVLVLLSTRFCNLVKTDTNSAHVAYRQDLRRLMQDFQAKRRWSRNRDYLDLRSAIRASQMAAAELLELDTTQESEAVARWVARCSLGRLQMLVFVARDCFVKIAGDFLGMSTDQVQQDERIPWFADPAPADRTSADNSMPIALKRLVAFNTAALPKRYHVTCSRMTSGLAALDGLLIDAQSALGHALYDPSLPVWKHWRWHRLFDDGHAATRCVEACQ